MVDIIAANLAELFIKQAKKNAAKTVFEYRLRRSNPYRTISWEYLNTIVFETAYGLIELGLKKGDKIAILSDTRYEWAVCDLAILSCGGIVVPVYSTLLNDSVNYILNNSECKLVIVENKGQLQKIRSQWNRLPDIKYVIVIEDLGDIPANDERILTLDRLRDKGRLNFSKDPYLVSKCLEEVKANDLATIIYTSGTTGPPKGVMLTHSNILSVLSVLNKILPVKSDGKFLSFLPLSHVFERVGGLHYAISTGALISYCQSIDHIGPALKESSATIMLVVPRILEKMYTKINIQLKSMPPFKKKLFDLAFLVGKKVLDEKKKNIFSFIDNVQYYILNKIIFSSLRKKIAPKLKYFVSGGAPLSKEIAKFFWIIGFPVLEGYGLTETSAPATVNTLSAFKIGTVGKPLPNVELKIASDGEVLIKGPNIFLGYYKDEKATKDAFCGNWFCSGDIGFIDKDGFLKITDRKKDIIVSSSGKNIAPQNIESAIKTSPYISNVVVIGDKKKYLSALVALDLSSILDFAKQNDIACEDNLNGLSKNPKVEELIWNEIEVRTVGFADYEQIRRFSILPDDFTVESGEITPTLKVKRKFVEEKYKKLIELMYQSE